MPLPPVVPQPESLVKSLLGRMTVAQLAAATGISEDLIERRQAGKGTYSSHDIWKLLGACQMHGFFDLLPAHGVDAFPFDLLRDPFAITDEPIGGEVVPEVGEPLAVLPRQIGGFKVAFPFGVPASVLASNSSWLRYYAKRGFDILTYKTVRSRLRAVHRFPNWVFLQEGTKLDRPFDAPVVGYPGLWPENPLEASMANSFGVPSLGPDFWMEDIGRVREDLNSETQVLIVSVVASDNTTEEAMRGDFVQTAQLAKQAGAQIVEANFSCPNTPGDPAGELYQASDRAGRILRAIKEAIGDTPLFVKIGYLDAAALERFFTACHEFIDGIVAINTIPAPVVDRNGDQTFPDGTSRLWAGVSGRAIKPWAMEVNRNLVALRANLRDPSRPLSIIAVGGILTPDDVFDYLDLGVDGVESCTGAFLNPRLAIETRSLTIKDELGNITGQPESVEEPVSVFERQLEESRALAARYVSEADRSFEAGEVTRAELLYRRAVEIQPSLALRDAVPSTRLKLGTGKLDDVWKYLRERASASS